MDSGDVFCGDCGARVPSPAPAAAGPGAGAGLGGNGRWPVPAQATAPAQAAVRTVPPPSPSPPGAAPSGPVFGHSRSRSDGRLTNATRYLCAAAYLDSAYAATVIRELITSVRAVAPSVGIDLGPIIRHCLRARNIQLARDLVLSILLIIGLITDTGLMILLLVLCFVVGFLPGVNWARRSAGSKAVAAVAALILIGGVLLIFTVVEVVGWLRQHVTGGLGTA